jgi:hypothetical protein
MLRIAYSKDAICIFTQAQFFSGPVLPGEIFVRAAQRDVHSP